MAVRGKTASDAVHVLVHFLVQRRLCVGHVLIQLAVQLFAALGLLLYVCGAILRCCKDKHIVKCVKCSVSLFHGKPSEH